MIPKIIHQIWIGDVLMPSHYLEFIEEMKEKNPEFQHYLWGNEVLDRYKDDLFLQNYFKKSNIYGWKNAANRIKLLLLKDFGGICVDVDAKPIKGFNSIFSQLESNILFFTGVTQEEKHWNQPFFTNFKILGAAKDFRLINKGLSHYTNPVDEYYPKDISKTMFHDLDYDVCLFGHDYFYNEVETDKSIIIFKNKLNHE